MLEKCLVLVYFSFDQQNITHNVSQMLAFAKRRALYYNLLAKKFAQNVSAFASFLSYFESIFKI